MRATPLILLLALGAAPALAQSTGQAATDQAAPNTRSERPGSQGVVAPPPAASPQSANGVNNRTDEAAQTTGALPQGATTAVSALAGKEVFATDGAKVGTIERAVQDEGGGTFLVIATGEGGPILSAKRFILSTLQVKMQGDRLTAPLSEQEARRLPAWDSRNRAYKDLEGGPSAQVRLGS